MSSMEVPVIVSLRVRPLLARDLNANAFNVINQVPSDPKVVIAGDRGFAFDHVFIDTDQETVYEEMMKPIVDIFLKGYNCTVLAYGQTGSGKTYTMGTDAKTYGTSSDGLIIRAMTTILASLSLNTNASCNVSFIEIYNEEVYDLLLAHPAKLDAKRLKVKGQVSSHSVKTLSDIDDVLSRGTSNRHTRTTTLNDCSSRSHAIFTVNVNKISGDYQVSSKLNLVDLAGSEGVRKTRNEGQARQEGISINQGLLALGNVIQILSSKSRDHVPYRNSMLTTILQDCLQSKNVVALTACVSPSNQELAETVNTMRFAEKAKKVVCKADVNRIAKKYKAENPSTFVHMGSVAKQIPPTPFYNKIRKTPATDNTFKTPAPIGGRYPLSEFNGPYSSPTSADYGKVSHTQASKVSQSNECFLDTTAMSCTLSDVSTSTTLMSYEISPLVRKHCDKMKDELHNEIRTIVRSQLKRDSVQNWSRSSLSQDNTLMGESEYMPSTVRRPIPFNSELEETVKKMSESDFMLKMKSDIIEVVKTEVIKAFTSRRKHTLTQDKSCSGAVKDFRCRLNFSDETPSPKSSEQLDSSDTKRRRYSPRLSLKLASQENSEQLGSSDTRTRRYSKRLSLKLASQENSEQLGSSDRRRYSKRLSLKLASQKRPPMEVSNKSCLLAVNNDADLPLQTPLHHRCSANSLMRKSSQSIYNSTPNKENSTVNLHIENPKPNKENTTDNVHPENPTPRKENSTDNLHPENPTLDSSKLCFNGPTAHLETRKSVRCRKPVKRYSAKRTSITAKKGESKPKKYTPPKKEAIQEEHNDWVLSVLNSDSSKEIEKLPTVGPKTALIIFNYRRLNGTFSALEEFKAIPGLPKSYFIRFMLANNIVF